MIHAGFHKTGTTTLQETLEANRSILEPHLDLHLRKDMDMRVFSAATRHFSLHRNKASKQRILEEAEFFFAKLDPRDERPIFVSHENLSGTFIGDGGVMRYAAAPIALGIIHQAWINVMGSPVGFEALYTTRNKGWIASCHWQRVKNNRETRSLQTYLEKYAAAADLGAVVRQAQEMIAPSPVYDFAIENCEHPTKATLELLGLEHLWAQMNLIPNANTTLSEQAREEMLALNQSGITGKSYWQKRRVILGIDESV